MSTQVTVIGNLTRAIELRYSASGTALASFGLASNRRKKNGDQWEDETSYIKCVAFQTLAENIAASADKGSRLIVSGYLKQNDWTDKDGNERRELELVVNDAGLELRFDPAAHQRAERTTHRDRAAADPDPF
jgi:single-strand DNA-binding protein